MSKVVLEFRNGSYFTNPEADHGGALRDAMQFDDETSADAYFKNYDWVWFNGGMLVRVLL